MKARFVALIFALCAAGLEAGEVILPYGAFGPQAACHALIGKEWWQWDAHGDSKPAEYPIQVVVFWDQTLEETARRHPVDRAKLQDFRYVEYAKAVEYLENTIREFKMLKLDARPLEQTLARLRKLKA